MTLVCSHCLVAKPESGFYPDRTHRNGYGSRCKECVKADRRTRYADDPSKQRESNRRYWLTHKEAFSEQARRLRRAVLAAYGGKCACCGEATPEFLGIDHVNNDGEAHRRELKGYGRAIYQWLKRNAYPQDGRFQLLCHNCNMAKGLYGGCPHAGQSPRLP